MANLKNWLSEERTGLLRSASVTKRIDYLLKRWDRFAAFLDGGRIGLTNNTAERAAAMATLIMTTRLDGVDPLARLADMPAPIAEMPQCRLHELLPWEWKRLNLQAAC